MRKTMVFMVVVILAGFLSITNVMAKEQITIEKVAEASGFASGIVESALKLREQMAEMTPIDFVKQMGELADAMEPYVVLIAETDAPDEDKQFAAHVAMGIKSVELSLWYFLVGAIEADGKELEFADELLQEGMGQLEYAWTFIEED